MSVPLSFERDVIAGQPVVRVRGEVDLVNAARVRDVAVRAVRPDDQGLVLDLSETAYLDSAGMHVLIELADDLASHRQRLRVVLRPSSPVRRAAQIAGLDAVIDLDDDLSSAAAAFDPPDQSTG